MTRRIISVCHKSPSGQHAHTKGQLLAKGEALKQKQGFLHYRLLEPISEEDDYTLLTFWQSAKHYRQATR